MNSEARFLSTGLNSTYKAHAVKKKSTVAIRSPTKPIRNCHPEAMIFRAVAAASPYRMSLERPITAARMPTAMEKKYRPPATLAVLLMAFIFLLVHRDERIFLLCSLLARFRSRGGLQKALSVICQNSQYN